MNLEILTLGNLIALTGILASICFGTYQLRKQFQWNKSKLAYDLLKEWTDQTLEHRRIIEKQFGSYLIDDRPVDVDDPKAFVAAGRGDEYDDLKTALCSILNYFEQVAVLYKRGMLDRLIIDQCLQGPMIRYYHKVKTLKGHVDRTAGGAAWRPLDDLIFDWEKNRIGPPIQQHSFPG